MPKVPALQKLLFNDDDLSALRRGFYTQAPTICAMLLPDDLDEDSVKETVELTIEIIEALIDHIGAVLE